MKNSISNIISESIEKNFLPKMIIVNDKEMEYGSSEHIQYLKNTLLGLESLRNMYAKGTTNRHIYSNAAQRLRGLIIKLES